MTSTVETIYKTRNSKAFIKGIISAGYDPDIVMSTWVEDKNIEDYYENYNVMTHCICGVVIRYVHTIRNPDNNKECLNIGEDCASSFMVKFIDRKVRKLCDMCCSPHRNRKDNICNLCRLKPQPQPILLKPQQPKKIIPDDVEYVDCSNFSNCGSKVRLPFKLCYECNKPNMKLKTGVCACGRKIDSKYLKCYQCKNTPIEIEIDI